MLKKNLKLLHIFPELGIGGTEKVILQISKFLIDNNDNNKVNIAICSSDGISREQFMEAGLKIYQIPKFKKKYSLLSNLFNLSKSIQDFNPDVIHTHSLYSLVLIYFLKKIKIHNASIIHTGHGGPRKNYDKVAAYISALADKYITISEHSYKYLKSKVNHQKLCLIKNGVDYPSSEELYINTKSLNKNDVLNLAYVGRLTIQKGLLVLIDAIEELIKKGIKVNLKIIGDGELKKYLENEVMKKGLQDNIFFLGYKPNPWIEVKEIPIIVMPSLWEPGGLVALEAIVRNHTVVVSNIDGLKDAIRDGENGYTFNVGDYKQLAKILLNIYEGQKPLIFLDEESKKKYYFNFSTGPKYESIYNKLLKDRDCIR